MKWITREKVKVDGVTIPGVRPRVPGLTLDLNQT